jgi:hypothetical protein
MATLTPELRHEIAMAGDRPLRIEDSETKTAYVLLREEVYERVRPQLEEDFPAIPDGIIRSKQAYLRDLPELLKDVRLHGKWVIYHGDERIGIANTQTELVRECLRRGLKEEEYFDGMILPRPPEPEEIDPSFFELTDEPQL